MKKYTSPYVQMFSVENEDVLTITSGGDNNVDNDADIVKSFSDFIKKI